MTDTGLPPDLPGEARPNYGAAPVQPTPPSQPAAPEWAAPNPYAQIPQGGYTPPPYPAPSGGMSTGAKVGLFTGLGCLVLIVLPVVILLAIGFFAAMSNTTDSEYEPWEPPTIDEGTSNGNIEGEVESQWKSGDDWLAAPAGETAPTEFLSGYSTPEEWLLYNMGADYDFTVVFTSDPQYNCGMAKVDPAPDAVVGCYQPQYGKTIFLWWGAEASADMKTLILLHEYSHYWQNWNSFDATQSAVDAGLFSDAEFLQDVWETDATCRIYVDWHYTNLRYLDEYTVSPCGDTGWGEHWFENELLERGVQVTDY